MRIKCSAFLVDRLILWVVVQKKGGIQSRLLCFCHTRQNNSLWICLKKLIPRLPSIQLSSSILTISSTTETTFSFILFYLYNILSCKPVSMDCNGIFNRNPFLESVNDFWNRSYREYLICSAKQFLLFRTSFNNFSFVDFSWMDMVVVFMLSEDLEDLL